MIIIISGTTHSGKTSLAQKLLEKLNVPYLSIDHIKMGLIRSEYTNLTPLDDEELTNYLWPIIREIIKTNIENNQNLIIEGCYIPYNFLDDFEEEYLNNIRHLFLILSKEYIESRFDDILNFANIIEKRTDDSYLNKSELINENLRLLENCIKNNLNYILINDNYNDTINNLLNDFNDK